VFECDCCGKIFHNAPSIIDGIDKMFCSGRCSKLEQGMVTEYTHAQREAVNKHLDKKSLHPRKKPTITNTLALSPSLTKAEYDMQRVESDRIARVLKTRDRMRKNNVRGR
jgi:hypothetical protein